MIDINIKAVSLDMIVGAIERDDLIGFCIVCGEEHDNVEGDARGYECRCCGAMKVYGAQELLFEMVG